MNSLASHPVQSPRTHTHSRPRSSAQLLGSDVEAAFPYFDGGRKEVNSAHAQASPHLTLALRVKSPDDTNTSTPSSLSNPAHTADPNTTPSPIPQPNQPKNAKPTPSKPQPKKPRPPANPQSKTQRDKERKRRAKARVVVEHVDVIGDAFWEARPWVLGGGTGGS